VTFTQVDNSVQGQDGRDKLIVAKDALQGLAIQHLAIVKNLSPQSAVHLLQISAVSVVQQKDTAAIRTRVKEAGDVELTLAAEAAIEHLPSRFRQQMGLNVFRELVDLHCEVTFQKRFIFWNITDITNWKEIQGESARVRDGAKRSGEP
jgi:hypothetical protein